MIRWYKFISFWFGQSKYMEKVVDRAMDVMGLQFLEWYDSYSPSLGCIPSDIAWSKGGSKLLIDELWRIEHENFI